MINRKLNEIVTNLSKRLQAKADLSCMLLSFALAWIITNGWAYVALLLGSCLKIAWLKNLAAVYLALIWLPGTPEKALTIFLGYAFMQGFQRFAKGVSKEKP